MADNNRLTGTIDVASMKKALATVDQYYKSTKRVTDIINTQKEAWNGISSAIFGISGSEWFSKVPKTTEELAKQYAQVKEIDAQLKVAGKTIDEKFNKSFANMRTSAKEAAKSFRESFKIQSELISADFAAMNIAPSKENSELVRKLVEDLKEAVKHEEDYNEIIKKLPEHLRENNDLIEKAKLFAEEEIKIRKNGSTELIGDLSFLNEIADENKKLRYLTAISEGNINELLKEEGYAAVNLLNTSEQIRSALGDDIVAMISFTEEAEEAKKQLSETHKETLDIGKAFTAMAKNMASGIIPRMMEFDKTIHEAQKNTGIMFTENAAQMTTLTRKTSEFGMSIADTTGFMGELGDELKIIDTNVLAQATEDLKAVQLATGISSENLAAISGEMMRAGQSSADVRDAIEAANVYAKQFGVNSKKVLDGMAKNITKMRTMGFQGGEESLMKMVATAERLRMNIDSIFNVAEKARTIEGAMEMAAQLQLAGGSFANVNPMDLLAASRNNPEELQKILTQMGSDIGHFDKETGKYTFDAVDVDRLKIMADATGVTLDEMQRMIQKNAEDNKKINLMPDISFDGLKDKDGNPIDPDQIKNTLLDSVDMTGKVLEGSVLDKAGIKNLSEITQEQAESIMQDQIEKNKNLELQAKQNQDFQAAVTAMKDALLNMFTYLQPVVEFLTRVAQVISKVLNAMGPIGTVILTAVVGLATVIPLFVLGAGKFAMAINQLNLLSGKGGGGGLLGKIMPGAGKTGGGGISGAATKGMAGQEQGLTGLSKGLTKMGTGKVTAGAANLMLASLAFVTLLPGIPSMLVMAAIGTPTGAGLEAIAKGLNKLTKGAAGAATLMLTALAFTVMTAGIAGMAAIALLGAPVATALGVLGPAFKVFAQLMAEPTPLGVPVIGIMALVVLMIGQQAIMLGAALLLAAPGIKAFGVVIDSVFNGLSTLVPIVASAISMLLESLTMEKVAVMYTMAPALFLLSSGLAAFAAAGILFTNPVVLAGMLLMNGVLASTAIVMAPLAEALSLGGKGIDSMAEGVVKLTDSLAKLDFEKLQQLKEFSQSMALASLASGAMSAMVAVVDAIGKIGGGKENKESGGTKTVVIQLKMPNGRVIEEHIIKDIDKAT